MNPSPWTTGLESSQTYTMYHGTTLQKALQIQRNGFVPSLTGMLGPGVYVSRNFQKASSYPKYLPPGEEQAILQLTVRVGKVKKIDYQGHPLQYTWHQAGYDTAWVPPYCGMVPSGLEEDCVWDPSRITVLAILNKDGSTKDLSSYGIQPANSGCSYPTPTAPFNGFPSPTPMMSPFGMPCPPPMMPPFGMPYSPPMMPPFGMPYSPPMMPPFGMPYSPFTMMNPYAAQADGWMRLSQMMSENCKKIQF